MSVRPFGYRVLVSDLPNPDEHRQIVLPPTVREHDLRRGVVEAAPPEESEPTGSAYGPLPVGSLVWYLASQTHELQEHGLRVVPYTAIIAWEE